MYGYTVGPKIFKVELFLPIAGYLNVIIIKGPTDGLQPDKEFCVEKQFQ